jgi:hypothetical protein
MPVDAANMPLPDACFKSNRAATLGVVCTLHTKLAHHTHLLIKCCLCLLAEVTLYCVNKLVTKMAVRGTLRCMELLVVILVVLMAGFRLVLTFVYS